MMIGCFTWIEPVETKKGMLRHPAKLSLYFTQAVTPIPFSQIQAWDLGKGDEKYL